MDAARIPVLIAGGGPVGLALAIELGRSGIACILVEKRDGTVTLPKMSGLTIRCMEFGRRWGIAAAVRKTGWPAHFPQDYVYCTSLTGPELGRQRIPPFAEQRLARTPEPRASCAQLYYDPILQAKARSLSGVTLRYRASLRDFTEDRDGIRATVTDEATGKDEIIAARYLVGCDGAEGAVARALATQHDGRGLIAPSYNLFFRAPRLMEIHRKGWARFFRFTDAGGSWGELVGIDGKQLWRLSVFATDRPLDPAGLIRRLAGVAVDYDILSAMPWERSERVSKQYRRGSVFLAGDAAHQNSPTGGLGLHIGLADAVDLGWKLAARLRGWGGEALLDSYESERRPAALLNVRASSEEFDLLAALPGGEGIEEDSARGAALRERWAEAFRASNGATSRLYTENMLLGYCYEGSPICVPDGSPPISIERRDFVAAARPGMRAPHAWLGEGRSTLDLFGNGFVLLRFAGHARGGNLAEAGARRGVPLQLVDIADPAIAELYERNLVLVRPDGHVAWRGDEPPEDADALIDRVRGARAPR